MANSAHAPRNNPDPSWVWATPAIGVPWCTCGVDPLTKQPPHQVTRPLVTKYVTETLGSLPERMTNREIAVVVQSLWRFPEITPPIAESLMRSVKAVNAQMAEDYPLATAMAAVKHFSNTWSGDDTP